MKKINLTLLAILGFMITTSFNNVNFINTKPLLTNIFNSPKERKIKQKKPTFIHKFNNPDHIINAIYFDYLNKTITDNKKIYKFFEKRNQRQKGLIMTRYKNLKPKIERLENLLHIENFKYIIGTESDFNRFAKSYNNAMGFCQLTTSGINEIKENFNGNHNRNSDRYIISQCFDIEKVNNYNISNFNPFTDEIKLENFGYKKDYTKKTFLPAYNMSKRQLTKIILPRYIFFNKLFDKNTHFNSALINPDLNLKVGAALWFSYKLQLTFSDVGNLYKKDERLLPAAYNVGISKILNLAYKYNDIENRNIYSYLGKIKGKEALTHYQRYKEYQKSFKEVRNKLEYYFNNGNRLTDNKELLL